MWKALYHSFPVFLAFLISFAVLTSFWMSHQFIVTGLARNANRNLTYLNIIFLLFLSVLPFSAHLMGRYPQTQPGVLFFGVNIIGLALSLRWTREYIIKSRHIENDFNNEHGQNLRYGNIRIWMPIVFAMAGILVSFVSPSTTLVLYAIPLVINLIPGLITLTDRFIIQYLFPPKRTNL